MSAFSEPENHRREQNKVLRNENQDSSPIAAGSATGLATHAQVLCRLQPAIRAPAFSRHPDTEKQPAATGHFATSGGLPQPRLLVGQLNDQSLRTLFTQIDAEIAKTSHIDAPS